MRAPRVPDVDERVEVLLPGPDFMLEGTVLYWSEPWNLDDGRTSRTRRKCCVRIYVGDEERHSWVHADYLRVVK